MRLRALRFLFVSLVVLLAASLSLRAQVKDTMNLSNLNAAQELCRIIGSQFVVPTINYEPVTPPKFWTNGMQTELGFSQISLTNWAAGGSGSVALNTFVNANANYAKGSMFWDNRVQLAYGFLQSFEDGYRKSNDKIVIDSKWGYKAITGHGQPFDNTISVTKSKAEISLFSRIFCE